MTRRRYVKTFESFIAEFRHDDNHDDEIEFEERDSPENEIVEDEETKQEDEKNEESK